MPSDEIAVHYRCQPEGEYLDSVIKAHTDFILATTKAPLLLFPVRKTATVIIEEKTQVWNGSSGQAGLLFVLLCVFFLLCLKRIARGCMNSVHLFLSYFFFAAAEGLRVGVNYSKGIVSSSKWTRLHLCEHQSQDQQQRTRCIWGGHKSGTKCWLLR